jgi:hypothetical protein
MVMETASLARCGGGQGAGQSQASLGNWVRLVAKDELGGAGSDDVVAKVSAEQMEIAWLLRRRKLPSHGA